MNESIRILCVDDEQNVLRSLERIFIDDDYDILTAGSSEEGLSLLAETPGVQVVISDYRMPGMNGVDFLKEVCNRWPDTVRIVLSGYADTAAVVSAINEGQIYKFVPKPWNDDELRMTVVKAIETFMLHRNNIELANELRQKNEELQHLNENLELLVMERNSELVLQNRALSHAQNILQLLPVGVIGVVPDGVIVQLNLEAVAIIGGGMDTILGEKMDDVLPPELCTFVGKVLADKYGCVEMIISGEKVQAKGICIIRDGQQGIVLALNRLAGATH
ncbi:MAG: two-component system NtrC family sensor [Geobacteraceae bacterium]|nr:MAG: two-component system NtrC family sensor [Geobacteraceae bacterium]